jgi:hypothetical protein
MRRRRRPPRRGRYAGASTLRRTRHAPKPLRAARRYQFPLRVGKGTCKWLRAGMGQKFPGPGHWSGRQLSSIPAVRRRENRHQQPTVGFRRIAAVARALRTEGFAESARGISPRAAHRTGRDTLASSGSCHRTKAAALNIGFLPLPVDPSQIAMTRSLRSTGITPASSLLPEQSAPARRIGTFSLAV